MRGRGVVAIVALTLLAGGSAAVAAQSLAEIAKKEEERRKDIKAPAKIITNKDLAPAPAGSAPPPAATPAQTIPASADASKETKDEKDAKSNEPAKDKAYWAGRLKTLQDALERDQTYADALQSRINALTTDFVNRGDPAQRAVIERNRQRSIAELAKLKEQIRNDKKALADLDEEARRAGVPPGWLR